jgi:hypothetical protein
MTVTEEVPAVVAGAVAELADEQWRVARLVDAARTRNTWDTRLGASARWRLVRLGHFPQYAAELDWTPREVTGHLRDSARIFTERLDRIRAESEPALPDFVTDAPERLADYRSVPLDRLVEELRAAQAGLLQAVAGVPTSDLDRGGMHEVDGRVTVADILAFLPAHQRDHAQQMAALLGR